MKVLNKVKIISSKEQNKIPERITGFDLDKKPDTRHDVVNENLIRYSNLIELVSDGIAIISPRGIITYCNPAFITLTGYGEDEIVGRHIAKIPTIPKRELPKLLKVFNSLIRGKNIKDYEFVYRTKNKELRNVRADVGLIKKNGKISEILVILKDITEQKQIEESLKNSERKFRMIFEYAPDAYYINDPKGNFIDGNKAAEQLIGYKKEELLGKNFFKIGLLEPKQLVKVTKLLAKNISGHPTGPDEITLRRKDNRKVISEVSTFPVKIGDKSVVLGIARDITERKKSEEKIKYLSFHDSLTGLYNRAYFDEELKRLNIKRGLPLSIIVGDVNGLKLINDAFGHLEGDLVLCEISKILENCLRKGDILARWGGDEFSILLPNADNISANEIIKRIKKECDKTHSKKIPLSISLGTATKEKPRQDMVLILKEAEDNMYKQKLLESKSFSNSVILSLKKTLWEKSKETEEHGERLKKLSTDLGRAINLPQNKLDELALLSDLHDIGKITVPDEILLKKDKLTKSEWEIIKRHPEIGHNITESSVQLAHIAEAILSHHENWDGSGYPQGLHEEEIPIISRIIAIVDAYDAMRYGRVYKPPISEKEIILELERNSETQFDPIITRIFIDEILYSK